MLDMGFLPAMETIIAATPESRQTLLFSATIDGGIMKSIGSMLKDPAFVEIAHKGETAETVEQFIMPIAHRSKPELLRAVLDEKGSERVIVFARTKNRAEEFTDMLRDHGYRAESIHSDKSQFKRKKALDNFRRGRTSILVATDVLARGIDVADVDHVINLDLPDCPEDYVHRIGRTGRAGESGYAISFVSRETRNTLRDIEKLIGKDIPFMKLETYELDPSVLEKPKKGRRPSSAGKRGASGNRNRSKYSGTGRRNDGGGYRSASNHSGGGKRSDDRRNKQRQGGGSRNGQDRRQSADKGNGKREGSANLPNAAQRVSSSGRKDDQQKKAGKQRSKHQQNSQHSQQTYDYSHFA